MKKNILIIVLSVVALLLAGTVGYLVADKVISSKYENGSNGENNDGVKDNENSQKDETKELSLNDNLVTSLIYPKDLTVLIGYIDHWNYKNEKIDTLGRSKMMYNAAFGLTPTNGTIGEKHYSADQIKNNFIKIYGPDVEYYDGNVSDQKVACTISKYDSAKNIYIEYTGCGVASVGYIDRVTQKYKAEQNGDYIYVYEYVKSVWLGPSLSGELVVYLVDQNDQKTTVLNGANESNYENIINQMMDKGEVDTYKWTFKKQSDGKYYFYSGAWEN